MILKLVFIPLIYRSGIGFFLSLSLSLLLGKKVISWLKEKEMIDYFRLYSPSRHKSKRGTPSGGGVLILLCLGVTFFLLGDISNRYIYLVLFTVFCLGLVGLVDDIIKKLRKSSRGLSTKIKLALQSGVCFAVVFLIYCIYPEVSTRVEIPFTSLQIELGLIYFVLVVCIILGSSNAVNISDGLDGLAAGCMIAPAATFIAISFIQQDFHLSTFVNGIYFLEMRELAFFWCTLLGAILGFLKYNRYPAAMFMGGVGSESLGGALGISAVLLKKELLLLIIGGVFVVEALSVGLQIISFRLTGKRVFKMAPIHHHFELSGLEESQIVSRFWIASFLFSTVAFLSIIFPAIHNLLAGLKR